MTNIDAGRGSSSTSHADFIVGPENRLLASVVETMLAGSPPLSSPLVFFGPTGSGKSHLLLGLVSAWKARHGRAAIYSTAIDFARDLADAVETQSTDDFRTRYRQASLIALDEVQLLVPKAAAQQELTFLIDATAEDGRWLVLTSPAPPEQLSGFSPRLQSRLVGGLTVPIALPDWETRRTILARICEARGTRMDVELIEVLADGLDGPVAQLTGALSQLELTARTDNTPITIAAVRQYLKARSDVAAPSLRDIAAVTARHFSIRVADLRSPSRRRAVVTARDVAMYLARSLTGKSLKQIGEYFAGRDHTTVSHGCDKAAELLKADPTIRAAVEQLRERLQPRVWNTC